MCFMPSMPQDNSAEIARQQQQERERRITEGRGKIDQAFAQFDDPYFDERQNAFTEYYNPQITDQYQDARRALTLNLARSGNLSSGAGARQLAKLQGAYGDRRAKYADEALNYGNTLRSDVERERSNLYQLNRSSADPSAIGSAVQASVGSLGIRPQFSEIGNLFTNFMDTANTGVKSLRRYQEQQGGVNAYGTPSDSVAVIR